ncbi:cytochrome P450 6a8-like [Zophobas morio]|uniref:cytochrome P450 6a8-like n=1 Tax=Zophobas morio TaxID=2755281 RepID=UPI0030838F55
MFLSDCALIDLTGLLLALITIFITYYKWSFTYWKNLNVPYLKPSIPMGNLAPQSASKEHFSLVVKHIYDELKRQKARHGGFFLFARPAYLVIDLEYVKNVFTKDFKYFNDRGMYYNEKDDPISAHLFNVSGEKWKNLRTKLTPTFTSGKMKMMFQTLLDCEKNLHEKIEELYERNEPLDVKKLLSCYTMDVIGSCAFGIECNSFKDGPASFREYGLKFFNMSKWENFVFGLSMSYPKVAKALKVRAVSKSVSDFFSKVVKDNVEYRESNHYSRKDFMQLLIEMKRKGTQNGTGLTLDEITAQSFVFFLAGFETSSSATSWAMFELAKNPDIQDKLRDEINSVVAKHNGKVTYEALREMKYMDQVINETLRKYPPGGVLGRECTQDYKVPDQDVIIKKGTRIFIPVLGIHYDEEYYPDPDKFDPERFNEENSKSRPHYAHIPFGEGPRICIGLRFGVMQTKVGLTSLLMKYKFTLNEKTGRRPKFSAYAFVLTPEEEILLNAEKI